MKRDWKREAQTWKGLAHVQNLALSAVANDSTYGCRCGEEPYTDGEPCPKCFAAYAYAELHELRERFAKG